jgi:uncharacterized protein (DUF362 family)
MKKKISRRSFLKTSAAVGATTLLGGRAYASIKAADENKSAETGAPDLIALTGTSYFDNTVKAIEALGGIERFVPKGSRLALNLNAIRKHRGTIVHPDITLAVIGLCWQAGAKEIYIPKPLAEGYWEKSERSSAHREDIDRLTISKRKFDRQTRTESGVSFKKVALPNGKALTEAFVDEKFLAADVYINLPISKHHFGVGFTGSLKNMMAFSSYKPTNLFMHKAGADPEAEDNFDHLAACIADLNTLRRPDLTVLAAIEFLTNNGPFGPGDVKTADTIVAGTDPVAVDAYAVRFLDKRPQDVDIIRYGDERGIGTMDLKSLDIREINTEAT